MRMINKSKLMLFVIILLLCCSFVTICSVTFASMDTNHAVVTLYSTSNQPYADTEVELAGKTYLTDKNGRFTTDNLPYGKYAINPKITDEYGDFAFSLLGQKVSISRASSLPGMQYLNNIYVYRKFSLNISIVNSGNIPVQDMLISVYKNDVQVMKATVTTCVLGNITFDWQEMPSNANGDTGITMGDELEVRAEYVGSTGAQYLPCVSKVTIDNAMEYVKLIAYKEGESRSTAIPKLYEMQSFKTTIGKGDAIVEVNNAIMLVYDLGMKKIGDDNSLNVPLDKTQFELLDSKRQTIEVISAYLRCNTVILEYPLSVKDISTVSYTKGSGGYLVSEMNDEVAAAEFDSIDVSYTNDDDLKLKLFEDEVIRLVNDERTRAGLHSLSVDSALTEMARFKSKDMKFNAYLAHLSPNLGWFYEQMELFNHYNYPVLLENIASQPLSKVDANGQSQLTPQEAAMAVFIGWKNSPGHYANMINIDVNWIGVGYNIGGMWTQLFAKNRSDETVKIKAEPYIFQGSVSLKYFGIIGTEAILTATPNEGYSFSKWIDKDTQMEVSTSAEYKFNLSAEDNGKTYVAVFEQSRYIYTTKSLAYKYDKIGGITQKVEITNPDVTLKGAGTYKIGDKIVLTAEPGNLYIFKGWYASEITLDNLSGDDKLFPHTTSRTVNIVGGGDVYFITWTAVFERVSEVTLKVELDPKYGATLNTTKIGDKDITDALLTDSGYKFNLSEFEQSFNGLAPSLTFTNYNEFTFVHWVNAVTGEVLPSDDRNLSCEWYITASEMTIKPIFKIKQYNITATIPDMNGSVIGTGMADKYSSVNLKAMPNAGYVFSYWSDMNEDDVNRSNPIRTISNIGANVKVKPIFVKKDRVTVNVEANYNNVGYLTPTDDYFKGDAVTLIAAIKDSNYQFDGWYMNNVRVSVNQIITFVAEESVTYEARYVNQSKQYGLTVNNDKTKGDLNIYINGELVGVNNKYLLAYGSEIRLETIAKDEYNFLNFSDRNREVSITNTYTFILLRDMEITVNYFKSESYIVMFVDNEGKVISSQEVEHGASAVIPTNLDKAGYKFSRFDIDMADLQRVERNLEVNILYTRTSGIDIEVNGGEIIGSMVDNDYSIGDKLQLNANTPAIGQKFSHWERNGVTVSYESILSIIVDGNAKFEAKFTNHTNNVAKHAIVELGNKILTDNKLTYYARVELDSSLTVMECGIILVKTADVKGNINHDTASAMIVKSYAQSSTGQFYVSKADVVSANEYSAVAYLIYKDADGNTITIYSAQM